MDRVLNTAPCGFISFRDDGTIEDLNATLGSLLDYTRQELLSWHMEKIFPPGGRIFYHTHIFPLLKMHGRVEEVYLALRKKDGSDVPVLLNAVRRERDGEMLSDCVFVKMIQRNEYEQQLLDARRLAEEANEAKSKFLSMMSHDLRTPLTTIYGHAGVLQEEMHGPLNDDQKKDVETIRSASRVLTRMIGDILEFAKLDSGRIGVETANIDTGDAIARAEALMQMQLSEAGISFTSSCRGPAVVADPDRLQQILLNLLVNAIKFTPAGGSIALTCDRDDDRVRIRIRDTGIGIAKEHLDRIFTPFVQLDAGPQSAAVPKGVGLGLAISRELARAMGGDVWVESEVGKGSVFTVDLPMAQTAEVRGSRFEVEGAR